MSALPTRVAIVGTRELRSHYWQPVRDAIHALAPDDIIVTGCADGIDRIVRTTCMEWGRKLVVFYARWAAIGDAAGPERNTMLVDYAERFIAMPAPGSRGTYDVIRKAKKLDKPVQIVGLT
jgi:predicted Rossmann fold nucleotide-binding protein DprA/Smf involved in DNA uptake